MVTVTGSGFAKDSTIRINFGGAMTDCDSTGLLVTFDTMTCRTGPNPGNGGVSPMVVWDKTIFTVLGSELFELTGTDLGGDASCSAENSIMIGMNEVSVTRKKFNICLPECS